MTYALAKLARDEMEAIVKDRSAKLRTMSGGGAMGMTPDSVKATAAWQEAKREFDSAFRSMQDFNIRFCRAYRTEIKAERAARRP